MSRAWLLAAALALSGAAATASGDDALLSLINGEDKAQSADAASEYRRRLALLPQIEKGRDEGDAKAPDALSLKGLQRLDDELKADLDQAEAAQKTLKGLELKDVKAAIPRLPGPPQSDLAARKAYWKKRRDGCKKLADLLGRMLDPDDAKTRVDEFGDAAPESLPRLRDLRQKTLEQARGETAGLAKIVDALANPLDVNSHMGFPLLSGLTQAKLLQVLAHYRDDVTAAKIPADGSMAAAQAATNLPDLATAAAAIRRSALRWVQADAVVAEAEADIPALTRVQAGFGDLARMADDVLADAALDQQFVDGVSGELYEPARERKLALLKQMIPPLANAGVLIEKGLIPYQKRRVEEVSRDGRLARYYETKLALVTSLVGGK